MSIRSLIDRVDKPEYLFSPRTASRRLKISRKNLNGKVVDTRLPWGAQITVDSGEVIGYSILALGVYDLTVAEVLARLTSPGETCIDAGANIGQMCSIMALIAGRSGWVIAFEPYSRIFERLSKNVAVWRTTPDYAQIDLRKEALSSDLGNGILSIPRNIGKNAGLASLAAAAGGSQTENVVLTTLDATIREGKIGVLKLDVEGHELAVLRGGTNALRENRIRDLVFEDHRPFPSDVHCLLQAHGYEIFRISRTLFGPLLKEPSYRSDRFRDALPNYLATINPGRARSLLRPRKWIALTNLGLGKSAQPRPHA